MNEDVVWSDYGAWLLRRIDFRKRGYSSLMEEIHNIEFYYLNEMDYNRAADGMYLRGFFVNQLCGFGFDRGELEDILEERPCSVLEMLVALAERCEKDYTGDPKNFCMDKLFWRFCENLGFDEFKNKGFTKKKREKLYQICDIWLSRKHKKNGEGGLFPTKNPTIDHQKEEIWKQMMDYLNEHYEIFDQKY